MRPAANPIRAPPVYGWADSGGHCNRTSPMTSIGVWNSSRLRGRSFSSAATAVEVFLGEPGQLGALREVLAQQPVGVLVDAPLPGRVRVAEVDVDPGVDADLFPSPRISGPWSQVSDRAALGQRLIFAANAPRTCSGL